MKSVELRKIEVSELQKMALELRKKLGELRFQVSANKLKNVKEMQEAKKDIARILTVIKEKGSN